jgi:hypothetical protein
VGICRADHATLSISSKVDTKFHREVAVSESVEFACGLKDTEFVCLLVCLFVNIITNISKDKRITIIRSRRMNCAARVERMGDERNSYKLLVGKPQGKRSLGRPRCRWVMDLV